MDTSGSRIGCKWIGILALGAIVNTIQIYICARFWLDRLLRHASTVLVPLAKNWSISSPPCLHPTNATSHVYY